MLNFIFWVIVIGCGIFNVITVKRIFYILHEETYERGYGEKSYTLSYFGYVLIFLYIAAIILGVLLIISNNTDSIANGLLIFIVCIFSGRKLRLKISEWDFHTKIAEMSYEEELEYQRELKEIEIEKVAEEKRRAELAAEEERRRNDPKVIEARKREEAERTIRRYEYEQEQKRKKELEIVGKKCDSCVYVSGTSSYRSCSERQTNISSNTACLSYKEKTCYKCIYKDVNDYRKNCLKKQDSVSDNRACQYYKSYENMTCGDCKYQSVSFLGPYDPPYICSIRTYKSAMHREKACEKFQYKY